MLSEAAQRESIRTHLPVRRWVTISLWSNRSLNSISLHPSAGLFVWLCLSLSVIWMHALKQRLSERTFSRQVGDKKVHVWWEEETRKKSIPSIPFRCPNLLQKSISLRSRSWKQEFLIICNRMKCTWTSAGGTLLWLINQYSYRSSFSHSLTGLDTCERMFLEQISFSSCFHCQKRKRCTFIQFNEKQRNSSSSRICSID